MTETKPVPQSNHVPEHEWDEVLTDEDRALLRREAEDDGTRADRLLWLIRQRQAELAHLYRTAAGRVRDIGAWLEEESAPHERAIAYFEKELRMLAMAYDFRGKKTATFPNGAIKFRAKQATVAIEDQERAQRWARQRGIEVAARTTANDGYFFTKLA